MMPSYHHHATKKRGHRPWATAALAAAGLVASSCCVEGFQRLPMTTNNRMPPGMAPAALPYSTTSYATLKASLHNNNKNDNNGDGGKSDYDQWTLSLSDQDENEGSSAAAAATSPLEESFARPPKTTEIKNENQVPARAFPPRRIIKTKYDNTPNRRHNTTAKKGGEVKTEKAWYLQEEYQNKRNQRRLWLIRATDTLLAAEAGTLTKGKWHELSSMLYAWSSFAKSDTEAPLRMEAILKRLHEERRAGNDEARADIDMYNRLLDAWACAGLFRTTQNPIAASQRAREILVLLQETYEAEGDELLMPNEQSFNLVLHVVCRTEGPHIARRLLALMEYLHRRGKNPLARPSRSDYTSVLNAYTHERSSKQKENAGSLAEGFLRHMNITAGITPDTFSYNLAIRAWSRSRRGREAAEHADRILEEMQAPKDIVTYSTVISAWATSGMKAHAVQRAEQLLRQLEAEPNLEPNTVVLNSVMSTWVKSRSPGACKRTEELLHEMERSSESSIQPDLISYNTHLHALSLQARKPGMAQKADALLTRLEERYERGEVTFAPNLFTYNLVIEAWSKSPDNGAPMKAAHVLRNLAKVQASDSKRAGVEPDTFSFNQVLSALSRSSTKGAAKMAEELLEYMEKAYRTGVHPNAKPDAFGYGSVIQAHARSGDAGASIKAEQLLLQMKERHLVHNEAALKPNRHVYNALMHCWAKSGEGTLGARKAEALLREMQEISKRDDDASMAPNLVTFNCVLNAWALSGTRCCGHKAESYLNQMWELYNAGDNNLVKPNDKSYNTVINAISKSKNEAKAQRALRILRRMDQLYKAGVNKEARPNEVTYTAVLNSCAFPAVFDKRTRRKALDTAIFTLEELKSSRYGHPNQVTYGVFFKACANLLPGDDEVSRAIIIEAFQQCCKDGQVGEMVLTHLRSAAPEDLFHELVGSTRRVTVDDLPQTWRSNVRERGRPKPAVHRQNAYHRKRSRP